MSQMGQTEKSGWFNPEGRLYPQEQTSSGGPFRSKKYQQQTCRLQHVSNVVTLQAPSRLALEAGIGRSAARWYIPRNFEGGHNG
jgi:hypothetical protein